MISLRKREVAKRVFAYEFNNSTHKIRESNDDRAPIYVLTPTGARCNRVFVVGVLLEREETRPDSDFWRIRISDPTGVFIGFIGKFQPDALSSILQIEPPEIVATVGKVRVFEGQNRKIVTIRPESITIVNTATRDYWIYETALKTIERIKKMYEKSDEDVKLAWQVYNPDLKEYEKMVKTALNSIREREVKPLEEKEEISEEDFEKFEEEFEIEEEEWDISDILGS